MLAVQRGLKPGGSRGQDQVSIGCDGLSQQTAIAREPRSPGLRDGESTWCTGPGWSKTMAQLRMDFDHNPICPFGASQTRKSGELGGNYCLLGEGHSFSPLRHTLRKGCSRSCKLDGPLGTPGVRNKFKCVPPPRRVCLWNATVRLIS